MTLYGRFSGDPRGYHFTDVRNVPLIRELGGLYPLAELEDAKIEIPAPGSDDVSRYTDRRSNLHRYVHLCFRDNHPMQFRAVEGGRIGQTIFLQIKPDVLQWDGVLFCPVMANTNGATFYSMERARSMIDFEVLYPPLGFIPYTDPSVQQRLQAAEKYEILVPRAIPLDLIRNLPNG